MRSIISHDNRRLQWWRARPKDFRYCPEQQFSRDYCQAKHWPFTGGRSQTQDSVDRRDLLDWVAKISHCQSGEGKTLHSHNDSTNERRALLQVLHRCSLRWAGRSQNRIWWLLTRQLQVWRLYWSYLLDVRLTDVGCDCHPDECNCHFRRSFIWSIPVQAI